MANIGRDTFQRQNVASGSWGTATDGQTWFQLRGTQTLDVTSNEGRMTFVDTTAGVMALGRNMAVDAEGLVRFNVATLTDLAGIALRFVDSSHFYSCFVGNTSQTLTIVKDVAGTFTTVGTALSFTYTAGPFYWIRYRIQGNNHYAKVWADGTVEPANWMLTATDSSITAPGRFGIIGTPAGAGNIDQFDSASFDDTLPPEPLTQPRWTARALSSTLLKTFPSIPQPLWQGRSLTSTIADPTQPVNIPRYVPRSLGSTLINYALNITTRFRLMSANQLKDIATRFKLSKFVDVVTRLRLMQQSVRDIATRFVLSGGTQSVRDIASRFRLMQQSVRDIATRFRLARVNDIATRFRLGMLKDITTRFRLKSADQLKDIASRFRLMSANQLKDIASRFRLMSANQLKDIASRFRLAKLNDIATRFRLARLRDIATRFRLMSANQLKDVASRFRLMSTNQLKDVATRFRQRSADRLRDIVTRFILVSTGTISARDIACRFLLTVQMSHITVQGTRGQIVMQSARGNITATGNRGTLTATGTRGNITVQGERSTITEQGV